MSKRAGSVSLTLTRPGWVFAASIVLVLAPAYLLNVNLMFLMAALFVSILFYNLVYAGMALRRVRVRLIELPSLYAETPARLKLEVVNGKRRPKARHLRLSLEAEALRVEPKILPTLAPDGATVVETPILAARRGWVELQRRRLETAYPFGLATASVDVAMTKRLLAFPRLLPAAPETLSAERLTRGMTPRSTGDYQYLSAYKPGDDVRMIHWKKSALTETPVLRRDLVRSEVVEPRLFVPDACPHFEYAVSALATLFHESGSVEGWSALTPQGERLFRSVAQAMELLAVIQPLPRSVTAPAADRAHAIFASDLKPE